MRMSIEEFKRVAVPKDDYVDIDVDLKQVDNSLVAEIQVSTKYSNFPTKLEEQIMASWLKIDEDEVVGDVERILGFAKEVKKTCQKLAKKVEILYRNKKMLADTSLSDKFGEINYKINQMEYGITGLDNEIKRIYEFLKDIDERLRKLEKERILKPE